MNIARRSEDQLATRRIEADPKTALHAAELALFGIAQQFPAEPCDRLAHALASLKSLITQAQLSQFLRRRQPNVTGVEIEGLDSQAIVQAAPETLRQAASLLEKPEIVEAICQRTAPSLRSTDELSAALLESGILPGKFRSLADNIEKNLRGLDASTAPSISLLLPSSTAPSAANSLSNHH